MFTIRYDYPTLTATFSGSTHRSADGHITAAASDHVDEVISAYEQYGDDCVNHIRGAIAFCLFDSSRQHLLAVRDRMGEHTLYYAHVPGGVVVGTTLRDIVRQYIPVPQVNITHLLEPMRFTGPVDMVNTWIEQVKRIRAGEMLTVDPTGVHTRRYWQYRRTEQFLGTREEALQITLDKMTRAVDRAMQSDKRVAIMLSGGVDSSAVAALAKRCGHEVHTVTAGYKGSFACDERDVARRFAAEQGFHHTEFEFSQDDYYQAYAELSHEMDEPITDSAMIAQWALFRKVKDAGYDVLLGGMGGDELFYGYPAWNGLGESLALRRELESIFPWNSRQKKMHYLRFLCKHWRHMLYAGYPHKLEDRSFGWWIRDDYYRFADTATIRVDGRDVPVCDYRVYKDFPPCPLGKELDLIYDNCIDTVMTGGYLYVDDRLGAALGLENRSPLIDSELMEWVMDIPHSMKYTSGRPKQFFKDLLAGIVPDYILYAYKRGFTPPTNYVLEVARNHQYKYIHTDRVFFNSAIADAVMQNVLG